MNDAEVKRLSEFYRMPESHVRHMIAIESGEIEGDVIEANPKAVSRFNLGLLVVAATGISGTAATLVGVIMVSLPVVIVATGLMFVSAAVTYFMPINRPNP